MIKIVEVESQVYSQIVSSKSFFLCNLLLEHESVHRLALSHKTDTFLSYFSRQDLFRLSPFHMTLLPRII